MAITLTSLKGTDSIAGSRITINDNFSTISSAINNLTSIINIATGSINNVGYGSNNTITTENVTTSAITVSTGNVTVSTGNILLGGFVEFGSGTGFRIRKASKTQGLGTVSVLDLTGSTATPGATSPGNIGYLALPRMTTANIKAIQNPDLGSFVFDTSQNVLAYCIGTTTTSGATGTWNKISSTGATAL